MEEWRALSDASDVIASNGRECRAEWVRRGWAWWSIMGVERIARIREEMFCGVADEGRPTWEAIFFIVRAERFRDYVEGTDGMRTRIEYIYL